MCELRSETHKTKLPVTAFSKLIAGALLSCLLVASLASSSQIISATAKLDSSSILIGGQTRLQLSVMYKVDGSAPGTKDFGQVKINWPAIGDTIIKQIEVLNKSKVDTMVPDKSDPYTFVQSQYITITSFDSGYYAIPPFRFIVNNDTDNYRETDALLLQVNTLPVDTTLAIKDIKPPMSEPFQWRELIPYVAWGLAAAALVALIVFITIRLSKNKPVTVVAEQKKVVVAPHIIALNELEKLREQKLWQEGKTKQYYSALSEILRTYIEGRFKVNALEQTTDEILYSFRTVVIDQESKEKLRQLLILADLVKFAKEQPLQNENEMCMNNAFDFVNGTLREEKPKPTEAIAADVNAAYKP